jgi:hypothetical protein
MASVLLQVCALLHCHDEGLPERLGNATTAPPPLGASGLLLHPTTVMRSIGSLPFDVRGMSHDYHSRDQPSPGGKAEALLPFPVFVEGRADVGTGYVVVDSFRSPDCAPQYDPPPSDRPQIVGLGWWTVNPRHPERGSVLVTCSSDGGENVIRGAPGGVRRAGEGPGGRVISCPGSFVRGRTYDNSCTVFTFSDNACTPIDDGTGRVFSFVFNCARDVLA